jgi:maltooligosyltrehalose synthase
VVRDLPKQNRNAAVPDMLENWQDARIKLAVIEALLAYRRDNPMLFARVGYQALTAAGSNADRICAVALRKEEDALIVVVARFPMRCEGERDWGGTRLTGRMASKATTFGAIYSPGVLLSDSAKPSM